MTILTIKRIMSSKLLKGALMLLLVLAMAISACTNQPSTDTTPAPSEAAITDAPTETPMIDPTEAPMPELPSEEWFIDEAWKVLEKIGAVHNVKLDKKTVYVNMTYPYSVSFSEGESGVELGIVFLLEGDSYYPYIGSISIDFEGAAVTADPAWSYKSLSEKITVTPDEIRAAGCTETEGEKFMDTLGRVYAEKLFERYKNEPDGSPFHAEEIRLTECICTDPTQWEYSIVFSMRGINLPLFDNYYEGARPIFNDGTDNPELFGWVELRWTLNITPNFDGTWSCAPAFGVPAG